MSKFKVRTGQAPHEVTREKFLERYEQNFSDPSFDPVREQIAAVTKIAADNYEQSRKAPQTRKAGAEFADPSYDLSIEWLETRAKLKEAQMRRDDPSSPPRFLIICGSPRNDGTCPGEMSKTFRLSNLVRDAISESEPRAELDLLDLSRVTNEPERFIHPCKGCVSTSMPLCHWPCSCYPHHGLGQINDWMAEIYEKWVAAHGVVIATPVHWYQAPSVLKLMIDRLVCADGGNPDPTSTGGKDAARAKKLELEGWPFPKHLAGRAYGLIVHGDVAGVERVRQALGDWLDWMGLVRAGQKSQVDRYCGYYEPYATSHETFDRDTGLIEEAKNVGLAVLRAVRDLRSGRLIPPDAALIDPRPK